MKRNVKHPIAVLGLPLDSLTAGGAVEAIDGLIRSGGTHQIATANLNFWSNSLTDHHLHTGLSWLRRFSFLSETSDLQFERSRQRTQILPR